MLDAGQDGIGRVWKVDTAGPEGWKVSGLWVVISIRSADSQYESLCTPQVTLSAELKGHTGPIMALGAHPEHNWVSDCGVQKWMYEFRPGLDDCLLSMTRSTVRCRYARRRRTAAARCGT